MRASCWQAPNPQLVSLSRQAHRFEHKINTASTICNHTINRPNRNLRPHIQANGCDNAEADQFPMHALVQGLFSLLAYINHQFTIISQRTFIPVSITVDDSEPIVLEQHLHFLRKY